MSLSKKKKREIQEITPKSPLRRGLHHLEGEGEEAENERGNGGDGAGTSRGEGRLGRRLTSGLGLLGGGAVALLAGRRRSGGGGGGLSGAGLGGLGLLGSAGLGRLRLLGSAGLGGLRLLGGGGVLKGLLADGLDLGDDGDSTGGTAAGFNDAASGSSLDLAHGVGLATAVPVTEGAVAGGGGGIVNALLGLTVAGRDALGRSDSGESGGDDGVLHFEGLLRYITVTVNTKSRVLRKLVLRSE